MQLFLSYSHEDANLAGRIRTALDQSGHTVWCDVEELRCGYTVSSEIEAALIACDHFIMLISHHSLRSLWMRAELETFINTHRVLGSRNALLPVRLDSTTPVEFSILLAPFKYADCSESIDFGIRQVLEAVGRNPAALAPADAGRLQFAIELAVRAGTTAMLYYNSVLSENQTLEERKNAATLADQAAQRQAVSAILSHSEYGMNDGILAEEAPFDRGEIRQRGMTWVIDPLDGTTNFRHRIPFFCSAIAALRDGAPYLGVVYDPIENEVFHAIEGHASRVWSIKQGVRPEIHVDEETMELRRCLVGTHISGRDEVRKRMFERGLLLHVAQQVENLRALGSGHLALAYVASGRLQAFFQFGSPLWDQVAGAIIVRNAGGAVCDLQTGRDWRPSTERRDFLAVANATLKDQFLEAASGSANANES